MSAYKKLFGSFSDRELKRIKRTAVKKVLALEEKTAQMTDDELKDMTPAFKERLRKGETLDDILPEAFAVCREAAWRVLGMRHYEVQIIGGIVLHKGYIAEMCTGEGKTLVATLPVYLNALTGKGVHVITVNDYLAQRDSEWMGKLYRWLGLSVGLVTAKVPQERRKEQYDADITYGTNNEFGFDYLRDNMTKSLDTMVQRGHAFAIIDEVDSILIDEARTPLIISGAGVDMSAYYMAANEFVKTLTMSKVVELNDKEDQDTQVDGDYAVDEKHKTAALTSRGVQKAEKYFGIENLMAPENAGLVHYLNQAIHAVGVMKKDIDYVVRDGEVVIVDEFTGRLMDGRRYNEGLHQAIEAKEGVKIAEDNQTQASVTFQNYFRLYDKLCGMTGTASTEADEFLEIYHLPIVTIPTNRPIQRMDKPDMIYYTKDGKNRAIVAEIKERHEKGQPILVGTCSVEKSEELSRLLKAEGIEHDVLNAKNHMREAEIVAQAGKKGAVTIATNMAGRGTDIVLGGNVEYLAKAQMAKEGFLEYLIVEADGHADTDNEEILNARSRFNELVREMKPAISKEADEVRELGGLFVIASERNENRRIDNQLRGRAGRQGDPGESRFYLSLEDDLMRLFGGEKTAAILASMGAKSDSVIESKAVSNAVENAQKKLESRNYEARKNVLNFDDVMDVQRKTVYNERNKVLSCADLSDEVLEMLHKTVDRIVETYCGEEMNLTELRRRITPWLMPPDAVIYDEEQKQNLTADEIRKALTSYGEQVLAEKGERFGESVMQEAEHMVLLECVDNAWIEHMNRTELLKKGIYLRSYGQHDPVVAFRIECFRMFDEMVDTIQENVVRLMMLIEARPQNQG